MKKIIGLIFSLFFMFIFMSSVSAKVEMLDFKSTLEDEITTFKGVTQVEEKINVLKNTDLSNYSENDAKINIYLFRGDECSHCLDELVYFAKVVGEEGQYYNLYSFETWNNKSNYNLAVEVAKVLGSEFKGSVPFTVIGNKIYEAFNEEIGSSMLEEVKSLYNSENKYDIKDYVDLTGESLRKKNETSAIVVIVLLFAIVVGAGLFIYFVSKSN